MWWKCWTSTSAVFLTGDLLINNSTKYWWCPPRATHSFFFLYPTLQGPSGPSRIPNFTKFLPPRPKSCKIRPPRPKKHEKWPKTTKFDEFRDSGFSKSRFFTPKSNTKKTWVFTRLFEKSILSTWKFRFFSLIFRNSSNSRVFAPFSEFRGPRPEKFENGQFSTFFGSRTLFLNFFGSILTFFHEIFNISRF